MTELCKPIGARNKEILQGLELILGYPLYCEKKVGEAESDELA